jgi:hypothetical protein
MFFIQYCEQLFLLVITNANNILLLFPNVKKKNKFMLTKCIIRLY